MNNVLWLYWLIIGGFVAYPFLMLYIEYRVHHKSMYHALRCPVLWTTSGVSVIALVVAIALYPSGKGMMAVFIFAMGLPLAMMAQELPAANRGPLD